MTKFVLAYRGGHGEMPTDEAGIAAVMEEWGAWYGALGEAVVDGGNPFARHKTISADGSVANGGQSQPLTGYSIIQADSIDAAVTMAKGCPVLNSGGNIEVAEAIDM